MKNQFYRAGGQGAIAGLLVLLSAALSPSVHAVVAAYGVNLVENPGAEMRPFSPQMASQDPNYTGTGAGEDDIIPAWEDGLVYGDTVAGVHALTGGASAQNYNSHAAQVPDAGSNFPAALHGVNYFYGSEVKWGNDATQPGQHPLNIALQQTVDVRGIPNVGDGNQLFTIGAYFGGWNKQDASGFFDAVFLDDTGAELDFVRIGDVRAADRNNWPDRWVYRNSDGLVPAGTAFVRFDVWFDDQDQRFSRGSNGAIDGLDFTINQFNPVPEPASVVGCAIGLGLMLRRRRETVA